MATTLKHPTKGRQVTVPDSVVESYTSQGWVVPGSPAPAVEGKAKSARKRTSAKEGSTRARAHDAEAAAVPAAADGGADD